MIKILHTADWHLGKRLDDFSRIHEQREVLEEICEIVEKEYIDVVLIAGDLFDTFNPSAEAQSLFYATLKRLGNNGKRAVLAIAGNHDQPDRIEAPDHLARECGIIFIGYPNTKISVCENKQTISILRSDEGFVEILVPGSNIPVRIIATPYANELRLKTYLGNENAEAELRNVLQQKWQSLADHYCDEKGVNILCSHLFFQVKGEIPAEEPEDERPILYIGGAQAIYSENVPKQIQYVALGHLHRYQVITKEPCPIVYSSSPLSYSFAEAGQTKYVIKIEGDLQKGLAYSPIALKKGRPLLRARFESLDDAVSWLKEHSDALVEITIATDEYLSAKDRKVLNDTHDGIVNIIPEVKNKTFVLNQKGNIDLNKSVEELFEEYFHRQKRQDPDAGIMEIFREILGAED